LVIQQPSIFNAPWQPISGVYYRASSARPPDPAR
jgi:hypothetical protein